MGELAYTPLWEQDHTVGKLDTHNIIISADIGQRQDYTAISVIKSYVREMPLTLPGYDEETQFSAYDRYTTYEVVALERWQGQRYNTALDRIEWIRDHPKLLLEEKEILIDVTGLGAPLAEEARDRDIDFTGIYITGGMQVSNTDGAYYVPRTDLINALVVVVETQRIKISGAIKKKLLDILRKELSSLRIKRNRETAKESFETWREGDHDDMVLSLAQAIWLAEKQSIRERIIGDVRTDENTKRQADFDTYAGIEE